MRKRKGVGRYRKGIGNTVATSSQEEKFVEEKVLEDTEKYIVFHSIIQDIAVQK